MRRLLSPRQLLVLNIAAVLCLGVPTQADAGVGNNTYQIDFLCIFLNSGETVSDTEEWEFEEDEDEEDSGEVTGGCGYTENDFGSVSVFNIECEFDSSIDAFGVQVLDQIFVVIQATLDDEGPVICIGNGTEVAPTATGDSGSTLLPLSGN